MSDSILLNDGSSFLVLNDGTSKILLNTHVAPAPASSGRFTRRQRQQQIIPQLTIQDFTKLIITRPFMLKEFAMSLTSIPQLIQKVNLLLTFKSLYLRMASKPIHGLNLIKMALKMDEVKTFSFEESAKEWEKADTNREKSFSMSSTFVGKVTFTPQGNTLEIELNGIKYGFCNVPERIYDSFKGASSKGAYFTRIIKGNFDC